MLRYGSLASRRRRPADVVALVATAALAGLVGCARTPTPSPSGEATEASAPANGSIASSTVPEAGAAELALVAPLRPGAELEGYSVVRIHAVHDGTLRVVCKGGGGTVQLDVALASSGAPPPPAQTDRFAVYYSAHAAPPGDGEKLALALAKLLQANAAAPVPSGLAPFAPSPGGGTEL